MEYTLPEEYIDEVELERQRKIHDSLITMGLKLISDSYLDGMSRLCGESGLEFEPRMMDGKHHAEILKDLAGSQHDLVVIGALGIGRARDSVIGSVCERVARQSDRDIWVVKHVPEPGEPERDTILVGVDGSPQSFGALMTAIDLARTFGKKVEAIAVYDPYLHYSVFNGIVNVLTEQAAKVFRFEEQNQLHEEIIDTGLAQIYQSHLEIGERMGSEAGVAIKKTLLDGKPFQKIIDHARKTSPWLIVLGRIGVHSPKDETALGSNTENILRGAPCDVLLSTRIEVPRLDVRAEETIRWTPEAEQRMTHVPEQVKGIARTGVLRLALEKGHSVITNAVIDEAMDRFMPKSASAATKALAEAVALERAKSGPVSMCRACGVTATQSGAVKCTVCGATDFEVISLEMIEKIAAVEGGLQEETTYDGRKLRWSEDARKGLWTMKNAYQRRRVKARVEKRARMKKLDAITLEFARQVIEEETGSPLEIGVSASAPSRFSSRCRSSGVDGARWSSPMNILVLLAVVAVFGFLRFRRANLLLWALAWWVGIYVLLRFGFTVPIPASVVSLYMGIVTLAIVAYMSSSEERRDEVSRPLVRFMTDKRYTAFLVATVVAIPALAAANVYVKMNVPLEPPLFSRTIHPASPSEITVHDKKIDLDAGENPFLPLQTSNPEEFRKHVENGRRVYYRNCVFCHGDNMTGNGMFVHGLDPIPTNFSDQGAIAMLRDSFLFWRIAKGGPGLPEEGAPWDSAMPAWEKLLKEDEIWEAILFLYDFTGQKPRAKEEAHAQ